MPKLRDILLDIATRLEHADLAETEYDALVERWIELCPHPIGSDLLFWPDQHGLPSDLTTSDTVDFALSWQPRTVSMKISDRAGSDSLGYFIYKLTAPETPKTQVATKSRYEVCDTVVVALKGTQLPDGHRVAIVHDPEFDNTYSCGVILGTTDRPAGTTIDVS